MRKEGGKYAHLNEDLHVLVEVYAEASDAYQRMAHAFTELQKYLIPVSVLLYLELNAERFGFKLLC